MNDLGLIVFPTIVFFGTVCLVFLVSFDYQVAQKEIAQLFAHTPEYSRDKLQFALRQALHVRNALISFHLSSICFVLSVPAASASFWGWLTPSFLVTLLWVVGFGCIVYGIGNLLNKLGNEHS